VGRLTSDILYLQYTNKIHIYNKTDVLSPFLLYVSALFVSLSGRTFFFVCMLKTIVTFGDYIGFIQLL